MKTLKRHRAFLLKLFVSFGVIVLMFRHIELKQIGSLVAAMDLRFSLLMVVLVTIERALFAYKWKSLLVCKGFNISFWSMLKLYYISNFLSTFVPSTISFDVIRAYHLKKDTGDLLESVSSVFVDKMLSLLSVLLLPLVVFLVHSGMDNDRYIMWLLVLVLAGFCLCVALLHNRTAADQILRIGAKLSPRFAQWLRLLRESICGYTVHKSVLARVLGLSVIIQVIRVLGIFTLGLALGQHVGIVFYFVFVPLINLIAVLPFSLAGIGIQEGSFIYFFSQVGMTPTDAFTLSIVANVIVLVSILPGGLFYLLQRTGPSKSASQPASLAPDPVPRAR